MVSQFFFCFVFLCSLLIRFLLYRMNRRKADFKFAYKFLEDEV